MAYRMVPLPLTFNDVENHLLLETFLSDMPWEIQRVLSTICLHMNRKAHMACKFIYFFENEGLLKVTASHVRCKCGNMLETVTDSVVVTTDQ